MVFWVSQKKKQWKIINPPTQVAKLTYKMWLFTRGSKHLFLLKMLLNTKYVVASGKWSPVMGVHKWTINNVI